MELVCQGAWVWGGQIHEQYIRVFGKVIGCVQLHQDARVGGDQLHHH